MKKLLFTAIALVAFSGVSMANTIADEEIKENKNLELLVIKANPCKNSFSAGLSLGYALGMNDSDAWSLADSFYAMCEFKNRGV